jgi:hypothetical protein
MDRSNTSSLIETRGSLSWYDMRDMVSYGEVNRGRLLPRRGTYTLRLLLLAGLGLCGVRLAELLGVA